MMALEHELSTVAGEPRRTRAAAQTSAWMAVVAALGTAGCGGDDTSDTIKQDEPTPAAVLRQPVLDSISPTTVALGDELVILGSDFPAGEERAQMILHFTGRYQADDGAGHEVDVEIPVRTENPGVASAVFDEHWFRGGKISSLGTLSGKVRLRNRDRLPSAPQTEVNQSPESSAQEVSFQLRPSLVVDQFGPADGSKCEPVVRSTTSDAPLRLAVRAIGYGEATPTSPWSISMAFTSPELSALFVSDKVVRAWALGDRSVATPAKEGSNEIQISFQRGSSFVLDPARSPRDVRLSPPVNIRNEVRSDVKLAHLAAAHVEKNHKGSTNASMVLELTTASGAETRRTLSLAVWHPIEVGRFFQERTRVVRKHKPHIWIGCSPGGDTGFEMSCSEGKQDQRAMAVRYQWDNAAQDSVGANAGNFQPQLMADYHQSLSDSFGGAIDETKSSDTSTSANYQKFILPNYFGACWRQPVELAHEIDIIYHNSCGQSAVVGQAVITDWTWQVELAMGQTCPPEPKLKEE
jgi:hypothetical protein